MTISTIIPIYHGSKYIEEKLNMINKAFQQANVLKDAELIFVNDSPDEEITYYKSFKNFKFTIRVIKNETNMGIHYSRVQGLKASFGKYIHFLDQDDEILEDFYKDTLANIKNDDVIVSNCILERENAPDRLLYRNNIELNNVKKPYLYIFLDDRIISPGQCLIRKNSIPTFWEENIMTKNGADDFLLWILMFEEKRKFLVIKKPLYIHKNTGENYSSDENRMKESLSELTNILSKYDNSKFYKFMKGKVDFLNGEKKGLSLLFFLLLKLRRLRIKLFEK